MRALLSGLAVAVTATVPAAIPAPASAAPNLVPNPKLETMAGKLPKCWTTWSTGHNTAKTKVVAGRSGKRAVQIDMKVRVSGARALVQTPACAIKTTGGKRFDLSFYLKSDTAKMKVVTFRKDAKGKWHKWKDLAVGGASAKWKRVEVRTPFAPDGTTAIRFGLAVEGKGKITTDDYTAVRAPGVTGVCTDPNGCTQGKWAVREFGDPVPDGEGDTGDGGTGLKKGVRAMHAVLLVTGKVLLIAGSGNNRANFDNRLEAGRLVSWLYDPIKNTYKKIGTPSDMFCAGHVQLSDGRVLVMGGTKKYPDYVPQEDGWLGEERSYLFDPFDEKYIQTNDMSDGHWYPSATVLGNGDVYTVGGYAGEYAGGRQQISRVTELFKYDKNSKTGGKWLPENQVVQTGINWATYPSLILTQDNRLFYTGASVFGHPTGNNDGNNYSDGEPFLGPGFLDIKTKKWTPVGGLSQDHARDQAASLLLPPAQNQKVMVLGGMNFNGTAQGQQDGAHQHTDIVDLDDAGAGFKRGPDLLTPKVYLSAVILPDGKVFETGGSRGNRAGYTHEASVFDPKKPGQWTPMAADPVGRTYHNSSILLPNGAVMAQGSNPASNFYDTRISIYKPPYFFKGPRPKITGVGTRYWAYGNTYTFKTNRKIKTAWLIRPAAVTHSSDPNQRAVAPEKLTVTGKTVKFKLTGKSSIAPPGWYMLFATDAKGLPSVARWIHVG
ncbi:galactose oxidase early set domain-containing protein [Actinocorallia herbida]|uniref:galactose oxidase early set domain-containing protein n=1 Tax=Actinocorallia herbida TaxID=58109 RepID=UPI001476FAC7|nr:galactose oxidase early set domain-containing protein [Actinocorallia herbida]